MPTSLLLSTEGSVRFITLNRPGRHNAFDDHLIAELTQAFNAAAADGRIRAVVLAATGKSFSAGGDLEWMRRMAEYSHEENLADAVALAHLMSTIDTCPKPVVGVVQGAVYGGGIGLVATCDLVVAAEGASFCLSEVKLGLIPATIGTYVVRAMGARAARRYCLTAEVFGADVALSTGLVHEVVPPENLNAVRDGWLAALKANGPGALTAAKELIHRVSESPLDQGLREWTAQRLAALRASDEAREGVRAFLEKRKPGWT